MKKIIDEQTEYNLSIEVSIDQAIRNLQKAKKFLIAKGYSDLTLMNEPWHNGEIVICGKREETPEEELERKVRAMGPHEKPTRVNTYGAFQMAIDDANSESPLLSDEVIKAVKESNKALLGLEKTIG